MSMILQAVALIAATWLVTIGATAHGTKTRTLEIVHPWTYEKPVGDTVVVAMKIKNIGRKGDRLLGASTPLAGSVTLAEPASQGQPGVRMLDGIPIAAGESEELGRKGRHIVLFGFKKTLTAYDTFPLTLVFERAGRIAVDVLVEEGEAID